MGAGLGSQRLCERAFALQSGQVNTPGQVRYLQVGPVKSGRSGSAGRPESRARVGGMFSAGSSESAVRVARPRDRHAAWGCQEARSVGGSWRAVELLYVLCSETQGLGSLTWKEEGGGSGMGIGWWWWKSEWWGRMEGGRKLGIGMESVGQGG
jgi:hypothetical protein